MSHIFISYSRKDKIFADDLELELEARDIDAWTDNDIEPGDRWREGIDNAIKNAFAVLV